MTKDSKQKPDQRQDGSRSMHDGALEAISQKVDEKLSQIASGSYDEEMERHLAEIQELRRLEKEEMERRRSERRSKRQKGRGAPKTENRTSLTGIEEATGTAAEFGTGISSGTAGKFGASLSSGTAGEFGAGLSSGNDPKSGAGKRSRTSVPDEKKEHTRTEEDIKRWTESLNAELKGTSWPSKAETAPKERSVAAARRAEKTAKGGRLGQITAGADAYVQTEGTGDRASSETSKAGARASSETGKVGGKASSETGKVAEVLGNPGKSSAVGLNSAAAPGSAPETDTWNSDSETWEASKKPAGFTPFWKENKRRSIYPTQEELGGKEAKKNKKTRKAQDTGEADDSSKSGNVSIAELARQAVEEAEAEKRRIAEEKEAAMAELAKQAEREAAAVVERERARFEAEKAVAHLTEEERMAQAVNRFFDSAEEIAAEEQDDSIFTRLKDWFDRLAAPGGKHKKRGSGRTTGGPGGDSPGTADSPSETGGSSKSSEPAEASTTNEPAERLPELAGQETEEARTDEPSRKLDESIDGFLHGVKSCVSKTVHISKDLHLTRKDMEDENHLTYEKRMARYRAVWSSHLRPVTKRLGIAGSWAAIKTAQLSAWSAEKRADCGVRASLFGARAKSWAERAYTKSLVLLDYAEHHKMKIFRWFAGAVVCAAAVGIVIGNLTAYEYMYNGRVLGIVKDQEVVYKTIDVIGSKLAESLDADIEIDKQTDITFRKVIGLRLPVDSKDDVLNSLTYMRTLKAKGYAIVADGKQIAVLQSKEAAQGLLDDFKERFAQQREGVEYKSVTFAQDVKVKEIDTQLGNLQNADEAMQYMLTGAVEKKLHEVQKGQTFNAIAKSYGLSPSELEATNPDVQPDKLKIGQKLVLTQDSPVLTVQTTEIAKYIAEIPFEIVYEDTASKYKGEKTVKLQGQKGQKEVEAEIVRSNGVEVSRKELSSNVISEPVNQVVLVGTKEKPRTVATGTFSYPVRGARLSSRYGRRWGRTHQGIDLAIAKGTTISASDGGTVTFSGYKGSYGYLVIIDHGNGKETYYAHCSKLLVSRGAKVYKGQAIAKVGSTGNSTGPHVHFEVHVNGVPKNPLNYL